MSNIFLIRHAFTPANNASYNNQRGLRKISIDRYMPLEIKYGRVQAKELGVFLNTIKGSTLILVSPYNRCRETLDIALEYMDNKYDILVEEDLREIYSGIHYAKTRDELIEECPEAVNFYEDFKNDPINTRYIGGESKCDVKNRTVDITNKIKMISESGKYDNIFILAHGEVNKWIYYHLNEEILNYTFKNCEVVKGNKDDRGKVLFTPKTFVPLGYLINIDDYIGNER